VAHPVPPKARLPASAAPDPPPPALSDSLLRVHSALTLHDLWRALRFLARDTLDSSSLTFEVDRGGDGIASKVYRHAHPYTPREQQRDHPVRAWLASHAGICACRLSDVAGPAEMAASTFRERVMRREGWDKLLCMASWRGRDLQGTLNFHRGAGLPDFSPRELRVAESLQPHFHTALTRVLAHDVAGFLAEHYASMLEDVPIGLLLLDWDLRPLWHNGEAAHVCAVWNHGERRAAALNPRRAFRVPPALARACAEMRSAWEETGGPRRENAQAPRVLSVDDLGLHAQVAVRALGANSLLRPAFQIQLDYRRPRGDRNRPLSPSLVALLARLSTREREVAMRVREGMRTAEIAAELGRSPHTIKVQISSIFAKLGVGSRSRVAMLLNR
jgi:DNA-binding CsgD family transcriptional regulator